MSQAKSTGRRGALRSPDDFNNENDCPQFADPVGYRPVCRTMRHVHRSYGLTSLRMSASDIR